jgi:hypothetical protein
MGLVSATIVDPDNPPTTISFEKVALAKRDKELINVEMLLLSLKMSDCLSLSHTHTYQEWVFRVLSV